MDIMAEESMKILAATHLAYITCNRGMVTESGYYPVFCNRLRGAHSGAYQGLIRALSMSVRG